MADLPAFRDHGPAEGFGSHGGSGSRHINIVDNTISFVERGINSPNPADQDWLISKNESSTPVTPA